MYIKILRKSPLSNFKLSDFIHDYKELLNALLEIEAYSGLIDAIIIDPSIGNFFNIDDTVASNKTGYSSQKIESMISEFENTYMR
jgi:hypothetical protein